MRIQLPGQNGNSLRFMERVETVDPTYDIFDTGLEHADGSLDTVALGGNFSTAKRLYRNSCKQEVTASSTTVNAIEAKTEIPSVIQNLEKQAAVAV